LSGDTFCWRMQLLRAVLVTLLASTATAVKVTVGRGFSIAVQNHKAYAFGSNAYGQLGIGRDETDLVSPEEVDLGDERVTHVAAGSFHTLFLTASGTVFAAGRNNYGQLGIPAGPSHQAPIMIMHEVVAIAAGHAHSLFVLSSGRVRSAGLNSAGQLGDGTLRSSAAAHVLNVDHIVDVSAGYDFTHFVSGVGTVFATGQNLAGQLGDGSRRSTSTPVHISVSGARVSKVFSGESHTLFLTESNALFATGANFDGQVGVDGAWRPHLVESTVGVAAAGGDSTCFTITEEDQVRPLAYGLGSNRDGQLGLGGAQVVRMPEPAEMLILSQVRHIAVGVQHSLWAGSHQALASGKGGSGELGTGFLEDRSVPVTVVRTWDDELSTTIAPTTTTTQDKDMSTTEEDNTNDTNEAEESNRNTSLLVFYIIAPIFIAIILVALILGGRSASADEGAPPAVGASEMTQGR
jgi:alpha-tubulin suppressor-like RCC1 family protein